MGGRLSFCGSHRLIMIPNLDPDLDVENAIDLSSKPKDRGVPFRRPERESMPGGDSIRAGDLKRCEKTKGVHPIREVDPPGRAAPGVRLESNPLFLILEILKLRIEKESSSSAPDLSV